MLIHWPDPQRALHHEGDGRAVRSVDRSVLPAGAERFERRGLGVGQRARGHVHGEDLARALAEPARIGLERAHRHGLAVLEPARLRGGKERGDDLPDRPRCDVHREGGAVLVLERQLRSVRGPGRGDLRSDDGGHPGLGATGEVQNVEILRASLVRGVRQALAVRRPGGVALVIGVVGQLLRLLSDLHQPQLIQGLERHLGAIWRERGPDDALRLSRPMGVEVELLPRILRALEPIRRREGNLVGAAPDGRDAQLAVGRVEQPVRREPGGVEGEYVGAGTDLLAGDHEGALVGRELLVRHADAIRRHHRRVQPESGGGGRQDAGVPGSIHRLDGRAHRARPTDEDDLLAVGGPARLELVVGAPGPLGERAGGHVHLPDVVSPGERPVRGEGDARAVRREPRFAVIAVPVGQLVQSAPIGLHHPDVEGAGGERLERHQVPGG